ncbi:hypothetical protein [Lihuaxuella thermophila]|uniref:hypothetical protein n=1 Tax=Lihuaxuella thermophila TaxID=1173111 RepID=UPI000B7F9007|nr:hypothetical protein [Lihuaxuella thermophila]
MKKPTKSAVFSRYFLKYVYCSADLELDPIGNQIDPAGQIFLKYRPYATCHTEFAPSRSLQTAEKLDCDSLPAATISHFVPG